MKSIALTLLLIVMSLPFHAQKGIPCANISIPDSCGVFTLTKWMNVAYLHLLR
jgi:hypothetical protein